MDKKGLFIFPYILWSLCSLVSAQDLAIEPSDLRIEQRVDGGFHLFIRKKPGIASVLLTESTRDPKLQADNYAYRAPEWNPVNGDEIRLLDGKAIPGESGIFSLIDSSPEPDPQFGEAFHIYIPYIIEFGYAWSRHGELYVVDGTYFNIRSFSLPFADYRGSFRDNPYILSVTQKALAGPPEGNFMEDTVNAFQEIASGSLVYSTGTDDLVDKIRDVLDGIKGKHIDIVLCLDTTESMKDDIDSVRKMLIPMLRETLSGFESFRIGMVLYKDYFEEYLCKSIPFTEDFDVFQKNLNAIRVSGGRDIPEAVYEALYQAADYFPWSAGEKIIILIGDAPPHPRPRGKITKEMVDEAVAKKGLKVHPIILPQ